MSFWIILALATIGHFSLHLVIYNRLNATGLRRKNIKRIEKSFIASCLLIPLVAGYQFLPTLEESHSLHWEDLRPWMIVYGIVCLLTLVVYGPLWIWYRPLWRRNTADAKRRSELLDGRTEIDAPLARTLKCRWQSCLPLNQLFKLSVDSVELKVSGLPSGLDGFKIAHLSDLHLTGHVAADYGRWVVENAMRWQPDLVAMTGDIIDKQPCIDWLPQIFGDAKAKVGCFFVLGNHDTRVPDPSEIRRAMIRCGWVDLGGTSHVLQVRDSNLELIGNEEPWFPGPQISREPADHEFRLLLSHSPDQIQWARSHRVGLMLAGHTHGGQGRLPIVGPILSPSWYGSRFASGDFYLPPTTMHVSRGLGGVHLFRVNCPPELSLITLRSAD